MKKGSPISNIDPENSSNSEKDNHMRVETEIDPRILSNLNTELQKSINQGSLISSTTGQLLPDASVTASQTSTLATSLYSRSSSISMESFTLETFSTSIKEQNSVETEASGGCCPKTSDQTKGSSSETIQLPSPTSNCLLPPPAKEDKGKICLVLDLDETLVHSSFMAIPQADFRFQLTIESQSVGVFVCVRPGAQKFLKELGPLFEIIIFTASAQIYADKVIDYIDQGRVIKHRLYRDSCTEFGGNFVKDLSRLNRPLEKVIIIDNSPAAYILQPYNAISISSWFDEPTDRELLIILQFLKENYLVSNIYNIFSRD